MESNKIYAAILVAGILAMLSIIASGMLVQPTELTKQAYPIEGVGEAPAAAAPPARTGNATKPAPAATGGSVTHPQSHPYPSPPPKVTARPRR